MEDDQYLIDGRPAHSAKGVTGIRRTVPGDALESQAGDTEFDAIVVGSGPGGATVARELSERGGRVLILERGGNAPLRSGMLATASILSAVSVGDRLLMGRALTTGGTSAVYFAATVHPPLDVFQSLGIDLSRALAEAERELPLAVLPDTLLGPQSVRLRHSAQELGHELYTSRMLIDQSGCSSGYSYEARWTARDYIEEAVGNGATLINRARALSVLIEENRAIGVEYEIRSGRRNVEVRRAYGSKIILAAGGAATPVILRRSGVRNIADRGFYCHPGFVVFGSIPGLKSREGYAGTWGFLLDGGIHVGDANFDRTFFRMVMLGERKWLRAFAYGRTIGMGVMVKDGLGGELRQDNRYHKHLAEEDVAKLARGGEAACRVIENAGGKVLFKSSVSSSHLGGAVRIQEHVDEKLETEFRNLHVCDGSVLPGTVNTPTLTLICLGKYLAEHIARAA
jgi:hypothetical protein